jgi:hypothetical protein
MESTLCEINPKALEVHAVDQSTSAPLPGNNRMVGPRASPRRIYNRLYICQDVGHDRKCRLIIYNFIKHLVGFSCRSCSNIKNSELNFVDNALKNTHLMLKENKTI